MSKILLVDDDPDVLKEVTEALNDEGHFVTSVSDLGSALREARMLKEGNVVVTDKNLGRHRGVEPFLDYLRYEKPEVKVILFSGEPSYRAKQELYCHDFVVKGVRDTFYRLLQLVQ